MIAPLAIAALLLPVAVVGQIVGASELDDLEREFESLAYGNHEGHHRHHGHRHLRHHKRAFLIEGAAAPASSSNVLLPGRHPSVELKLKNMDQEMHDLSGRQQIAAQARSTLEDKVKKAVYHMNDAVKIKRELARTQARLRAEELKLKKLEDDRLRLDKTHGHLVSSLHHVMEPKIQYAETVEKQRQRQLRDLESKTREWKEKEDKLHKESLAMLEERRDTTAKLEAANVAVSKAEREQEVEKKQLATVKHSVSFDVERYKYARTRARGYASKESLGEQRVHQAEVSVKRLTGILNMEQRRVDESMAVGKDRVQGKMRELEGVKEKTKKKQLKLSEEYRAWQRQQRVWARRVASTRAVTDRVSQEFATRQKDVLDSAQAKVASDAESGSDWAWDEWPVRGKHNTDEVALDDN